jgi:hypothetical protein
MRARRSFTGQPVKLQHPATAYARPVTPNVSYALLDAAIIAGRGEEPAVVAGSRVWTHARLLEEVAALGGVLRHLGIGVAVPCVVDLDDDLDAVVAALAIARLGGLVTTEDDPAAPVVLTGVDSALPGDGRVRLVHGPPGSPVPEPDLDWVVMIRAGRTDPAGCEVLTLEAAYSPERTVAEQIAVVDGLVAPYDAAELRRLLQA